MTKADLLILQDAAEEFSLESAENLGVNKSVCLQTAALAILCRVVSSLMAGEGEKEPEATCDATYRLGWNAALDEVMDRAGRHFAKSEPRYNLIARFPMVLAALRKPPRSNPND